MSEAARLLSFGASRVVRARYRKLKRNVPVLGNFGVALDPEGLVRVG